MGKLLVTIFLFLGLLLNQVLAQTKITLKDAIAVALQSNYSIQIAKNDLETVKINNTMGASGMLPNINATVNQDNQNVNTNQKFLNGTENSRNGALSNSFNANLELGWTVFNGTKMFITRQKFTELEKIGNLKFKQQVELTVSKITKNYFDIVLAKNQVNFAKNAVDISKQRLTFATDKFEAGRFAKTEMLKAQVDLNTDETALMRVNNILATLKFSLNQLLVKPLNEDFDVEDEIALNNNLEINDLLNKTETNYTGLQILRTNKQVSQFSINEFKADRWPVIQLRTGYLFNNSNSEAGFLQSATNNGFHYGAGLSFNVFNGFDINRKIHLAKLQFNNADLVLKDSASKVQAVILQLANNYQTGLALVKAETNNVKIAEENYSITQEQFKVGVITSVELRLAQQNLLDAQNRLITAKYETKITETELLRFSGKLLD